QVGIAAEDLAVPEQNHAAALADAPVQQGDVNRIQPVLHDVPMPASAPTEVGSQVMPNHGTRRNATDWPLRARSDGPQSPGGARDPDGRYANSPLKQWFDSLKSGKGPCCSDADGSAVSDVDWETKAGHYRVRLEGEWLDVPDDAVITEPNRVGRTMVWPLRGYQGLSIRCFMPGSMT